MTYSANLLGLEKAAARKIDFGAIGRAEADGVQHLFDTGQMPGVTLQELEKKKNRLLKIYSQERAISNIEDAYQDVLRNKMSTNEFIKDMIEEYTDINHGDAQELKEALGIDDNELKRRIYQDTSGRPLPEDMKQLRYIAHSQFGVPIIDNSAANIPFWEKLQAQNYGQLYPGLGVTAVATPLASLFGAGAGVGAGVGGATGTLLGNYIADASGKHLADDMRNFGTIGSAIGSLGGAVGGHMLQNAFKGKKKKKRDE